MRHSKIIYFDHAATSWPKPPGVVEAVAEALVEYGANPGRGAHRLAVQASRVIFNTRCAIAKLFHIKNPNDIVFTSNTSLGLNTIIFGVLNNGDHVIYSGVEHNSVRRPIEQLIQQGVVTASVMDTDVQGKINLTDLRQQLMQTQTKLVIVNHGSNLLGTIAPLKEIVEIAHEYGALVLVDAAQTAGTYPIDVDGWNLDFLAFPGHKGLLGPQGIAGLYISPKVDVKPLMYGGTGSQSEKIEQPTVRPDRYETGTLNTPGIAGLKAGIDYLQSITVEVIHANEFAHVQRIIKELRLIPQIKLLGPPPEEDRVGVVSFVVDGKDSSEIAHELDRNFGIAVRAGYHCSPLAHQTAGSMETGAVRISVGWSTTEEEIDYFIKAIRSCIMSE